MLRKVSDKLFLTRKCREKLVTNHVFVKTGAGGGIAPRNFVEFWRPAGRPQAGSSPGWDNKGRSCGSNNSIISGSCCTFQLVRIPSFLFFFRNRHYWRALRGAPTFGELPLRGRILKKKKKETFSMFSFLFIFSGFPLKHSAQKK